MGEKEYNYSYEDGRLVRATESVITLSGEIVTEKTVIHTICYYYNSDGQMTRKRISLADGTAQVIYYEHSDDNTSVSYWVGDQIIKSHSKSDDFGRKVFDELQLGTGFVSRQFSYHTGEATEEHIENKKLKSSPTTQLVSSIALSDGRTLSYEYDEEERITKVTETFQGENVTVTEYAYDSLGQLLTETVNGEVVNAMTYDNYGNIVSKNGVTYTYGNTAWKDLLTGYGDKTLTYDAQGNPINYLGHTLTWEKGRQLKKFTKADGTVIDYTYNANGIRTSKTIKGSETEAGVTHIYTLDGTKILRETWTKDGVNHAVIPMYDNEDSVCGIQYNGEPYYFQKNLQGDIIAIVDKDTNTVARYAYDAWGVCTITEDNSRCNVTVVNPYRYRGYYFDAETSLYYLQSRYYDAEVDRFVNGDEAIFVINNEWPFEFNFSIYCKNDAINMIDETGYEADYIRKQTSEPYNSMKLTKYVTVGDMGCGAVAVYNALHKYSKKINFKNLIPQILNMPTRYWAVNLAYNQFLNCGVSIFSMISYLKTKFWCVNYSLLVTYTWGLLSELAEVIIVAYWRNKASNGHYITGIKSGGGVGGCFYFYNTLNDSDKINGKISIWRLLEIFKEKNYTPLALIAISGKKGRW